MKFGCASNGCKELKTATFHKAESGNKIKEMDPEKDMET